MKTKFTKAVLALVGSFAFAVSALATDGVWTGTAGGLWSDEGNWLNGAKTENGALTFGAGITSWSTVELDQDVTLTGLTNNTASGVLLEARPKCDGTAAHFGFDYGTRDHGHYSDKETHFGLSIGGSGQYNSWGSGMRSYDAPQEFTGVYNHVGGRVTLDYRYGACSSDAAEGGLFKAKTFILNTNGARLQLMGRQPCAAVSLWCRLTPGSPDIVVLTTNFLVRTKITAGLVAHADGIPAGAFVRHVRVIGDSVGTAVSLSAPVDIPDVTDAWVTFDASSVWDIRQHFDVLKTPSNYPIGTSYLAAYAGLGSSAGFDIGSIEDFYVNLFLYAPTDEVGGWDGRFYIKGATTYERTLTLKDRALLALKDNDAAPTAAEIAADGDLGNPAVWMDASKTGTVATDAQGVTEWRDVRTGDQYVAASSTADYAKGADGTLFNRPTVLSGALNGKDVIDFGAIGSMQALAWNREVSDIKAVFLVLGSQAGGGTLLGNRYDTTYAEPTTALNDGFHRGWDFVGNIKAGNNNKYRIYPESGLFNFTADAENGYNAINGKDVDIIQSGCGGGYSVCVFSNPARSLKASAFAFDNLFTGRWGAGVMSAYDKYLSGGQRLAEVLVYTNALTKAQCQKIEAYLAKKWLDRDMVKYGTARVKNVAVDGTADVSTVRLGHGEATGRAVIDKLTGPAGYGFEVKAGSDLTLNACTTGALVRLNAGSALRILSPAVSEPSMDGCVLRVDASRDDCVVMEGGDLVAVRNSAAGALTPLLYPGTYEGVGKIVRTKDASNRWVLDFGELNSGCCLRCFTNFVTRTVFLVSMERANGTQELGQMADDAANKDHPCSVYLRSSFANDGFWRANSKGTVGSAPILSASSGKNALAGRWNYDGAFVDGVKDVVFANGTLRLASGVMEGWGGLISAIGGRGFKNTADTAGWTGGFQLAEMIIYDRAMDEAERRAVEAYLMRKWFGQDLPGAHDDVVKLASVELNGDATLEAAPGVSYEIGALTGMGHLSLANGTKAVVTGPVSPNASVSGGAVVRPTTAFAAAADPALHADAATSKGMTAYYGGGLADNQLKWWDVNDGIRIRSGYDATTDGWCPKIRSYDGEKYYIDFTNKQSKMSLKWWDHRLTNIRTVFWMFRDTPGQYNGGGFLLGDTEATAEQPGDFTRGNLGDSREASSYFDATLASPKVVNGSLRSNGEIVSPTSAPRGEWEVLSLATTGGCAADSIATYLSWSDANAKRWGGLQFGELIIYDRVLTEEERLRTEEYLMEKWLQGKHNSELYSDGTVGYVASGTTVTTDESGEAECAGLFGSGEVVFDGGRITLGGNNRGFSGKIVVRTGTTLVLKDGDWSNVRFDVAAGATLDLNGRDVKVKSFRGKGAVVNGRVLTDGLILIVR